MRRIRGVVVIATALSLLAAAGCGGYGGGSKGSEEGTTTTIAGQQAESHGTKDVSGETGKVEIEMYDDYFEPTVLKGTPGQKVELELKNEGDNPHTLTISDQMVDKEIQPGDEGEVEVTFPQSGQLEFVCRFHESKGMVGALQAGSSGSSNGDTSTSSSKY
jgi:plastocyanin